MASEKQILANRSNSQLSTGPRTESGKAVTRMNALQSGIHAQSHIIRGEDPEALAELAAEYNAEFRPVTPHQRDLVDTLVRNEWKIRRLEHIETDLWADEFERKDSYSFDPTDESDVRRRNHPLAAAFDNHLEKRLENLQRRLHAYERSTTRALRQLRDLQSGAGASACQPAEGRQDIEKIDTPLEIGFVPSNSATTAPQTSPAPGPRPPAPLYNGSRVSDPPESSTELRRAGRRNL